MAIQFESSIDVDGRGIIGSGNTIGTINASIIGANNNATTLSTVDSNTNTIIGDSNSGRYGNTVITDRTLRLGRADNIGATSSNTTGILNFNDSVLANAAYSNVGGITGYFPPPTTSNNYYFFNALDENVDTNVFQTGASPTASRFSMSSDPSLSCIGQKFDANTTTGGAVYITASNNSSTASSRGIFTFDARHQNQNSTVPDGHSLFEVTSGYGQTKFLIKQVDGQTNVGIGTTSPSEKLHVAGNMRLENQLYDSTNSQGTNNDVLTKVSAGTEWKSISDIPENVTGSGTTNYIPKWSNSSTLTDSGIVETSTLTTINNASFEYDYSGTTFLNIDGTTGTFLLGQPSTASRVYIHGIQTHLRFYTNNVKAGEFDSNQNFYVPNGNVGIGTLIPNHELVVQGTSSPNIELKNSNYSNGGFVLNRTNYTQQWKWWAESSVMYFGFATDESTYSTKLAIESSGNVGIGETNPDTLLHITGNEPTIKLEDNVGVDYYNPRIEFFGTTEGGTLEYISNPGFAGMRLHYRNTATNQDTFLELKNGQAAFNSANITGGTNVSMTGELQVFGGDTSYFSIGNVAIGATTSSERLYVVGNTSITNNLYVGTGNSLKSCTYSAQSSLVVGQSNVLGGISNGIIGVSNTIECTNEPWLNFGGNFIAGINNTINNLYSHANAVFGQSNAVGDPTTASNSVTGILASGVGHSTFGSNSVAFGESCFTDISAQRSLTGGFDCNNFGYYGSVAIGAGATASTGNNQYAFGTGVTTPTTVSAAYGADQFVVGKFNEYTNASSVPHRFAVGNGASDASRDTPFCVIGSGTYTNGQVSINDADGFAYTSIPYSVFHVNGRATSSYSSTFTTTSDERVKKNIVDYSKGLAEIIQVQPKSYAFNGKGNTIEDVESIGVLAQEIKEVFPETVGTVNKRLNPEDEQETELYTVDISPVTYALINAVKELNAKVEALEARIQTLEGN